MTLIQRFITRTPRNADHVAEPATAGLNGPRILTTSDTAGAAQPAHEAFAPEASGDDAAQRASDLPMLVLDFCAAYRLPPIPPIYETIYTHLEGTNPHLTDAVTDLMDNGPVTQSAMMAIHSEFLHPENMVKGLGEIGLGLGKTVSSVSDVIETCLDFGRDTHQRLDHLSASIQTVQNPERLIAITKEIQAAGAEQSIILARMSETLRQSQEHIAMLESEITRFAVAANSDHLTGLPNRRSFDASLEETLTRPLDESSPACLIMIDIDHFKRINDNYGHDVGDSILKKLASVIRESLGEDAVPARWGGEEFAVLVRAGGHRRACEIAERIRMTLASLVWKRRGEGAQIGTVTASLGIAIRRMPDTVDTLTKRADQALYQAKASGRNLTMLEGVAINFVRSA